MRPDLAAAVEAVSAGGRFLYTSGQLRHELRRRGLGGDVPAGEPLPGLLPAGPPPAEWPRAALDPDVFDYSVRRWFVFDRPEPMVFFARNAFHQKIEVGLVAAPRFPAQIWERMERQLATGVATTFYLFHDGGPGGVDFAAKVEELLAPHGRPRLVEGGLTPAQCGAHHLTELEEMLPLELLRFAYGRVVRTAEEIGFG